MTDAKIKSFKDLKIWQKGIEIVEAIYAATGKFPKEEIYGLASQLKRSAVSIPSNISEGFARFHSKEYRQFLYIALGSCGELTTQIIIAYRLNFIDKNSCDRLLSEIEQLSKMIMSLIKKLKTND